MYFYTTFISINDREEIGFKIIYQNEQINFVINYWLRIRPFSKKKSYAFVISLKYTFLFKKMELSNFPSEWGFLVLSAVIGGSPDWRHAEAA